MSSMNNLGASDVRSSSPSSLSPSTAPTQKPPLRVTVAGRKAAAKAERAAQEQELRQWQAARPEAFAAHRRTPVALSGTFQGTFGRDVKPTKQGRSLQTTSGSAVWNTDSFVPESRGLRGIAKGCKQRTQRVFRKSEGVSQGRFWQGIATAGCIGLAAGVILMGAFHLAAAALALGCIGFMGVLGYWAFKKQTA